MNNNNLQEQYNESLNQYNELRTKIETILNEYYKQSDNNLSQKTITQEDYIRLSRIINLAQKHLPKRELVAAEQTNLYKMQAIFNDLLEKFRNLSRNNNKKNKTQETQETISPYIISDELYETLRKLRHLDKLLSSIDAYENKSEDEILQEVPSGNILRKRQEGPGILDDYRQQNWGIERICLDGIQNHLPNDALGNNCWLHFYVEGKWIDALEAKKVKDKIEKVRFADDGVGYTPDNLIYLHSTKNAEKNSVGQFGEGMKMASMACVNLGLDLEFQSRNWKAKAVGVNIDTINTRDNDNVENHKKLEYIIEEYDCEPITGSRTIFNNPSKEFIEYALDLPEKVLALNHNYKHIFSTDSGDIVNSKKGGQVFVKGVYIKDIDSILSYNFDNAIVNPDRNDLINFFFSSAIRNIVVNLTDIKIMKKILATAVEYTKLNPNIDFDDIFIRDKIPYELWCGSDLEYAFKSGKGHPELWREAFKQLFESRQLIDSNGNKVEAVLKTDYEVPVQLQEKINEVNLIKLPKSWTIALQRAGVKTDKNTLPKYINELVETSLSLEYAQDIWNFERMLLDAIQNHLPSDSKGKDLYVRFEDKDGKWHDFSELRNFANDDISKIKFSDNGIGYDLKSLSIFASAKDHANSSGKWGEGLKMLSAVALRKGIKMELKSRDWKAVPKSKTVILNKGQENEKIVEQLVFETIKVIDLDSDILNDNDNIVSQSSTTFIDPSPELIAEFRNIKEKVLLLEKQNAIATVEKDQVLDFYSGNVYVRNILIPGFHNLRYGYHFEDFDIQTRDRNSFSSFALKKKIKEILEKIYNEKFIYKFLSDASQNLSSKQLEFNTIFFIPSETHIADVWIRCFKECFGTKTAIRSASSTDMNEIHQAQHVGLDVITLPDCVADALLNVRGINGEKIPSYADEIRKSTDNAIIIPPEELTESEKFLIDYLLKHNEILDKSPYPKTIENIRVFSYPKNYCDSKVDGFVDPGESNVINIKREVLNGDLRYLLHIFYHESGHSKTGAEDASIAFRNFFTDLIARVTMDVIPLDKVVLKKLIEIESELQNNPVSLNLATHQFDDQELSSVMNLSESSELENINGTGRK